VGDELAADQLPDDIGGEGEKVVVSGGTAWLRHPPENSACGRHGPQLSTARTSAGADDFGAICGRPLSRDRRWLSRDTQTADDYDTTSVTGWLQFSRPP
jgi:hypothetical protein